MSLGFYSKAIHEGGRLVAYGVYDKDGKEQTRYVIGSNAVSPDACAYLARLHVNDLNEGIE